LTFKRLLYAYGNDQTEMIYILYMPLRSVKAFYDYKGALYVHERKNVYKCTARHDININT